MAKDISNEDDDDSFDTMDDESLGFLEQVKKGKARNFVLSMKGNKVKSLLLKKKPIKDKDRKEARGGGFQPIFGVATGAGLNITFTVARSDGFDDKTAGTKTEKLKKFLKEKTGTAYKPEFALVDTPPPVPFDEEDLAHPLIAKFMKLEPVIAKILDARPQLADEIGRRVHEIRSDLQDDETRDAAGPTIDAFVAFLKQAGQQATTSTAPPGQPAPSTDGNAARAAKLAEAIKKLKPLLDQVVALHPMRKSELTASFSQVVGEIKAGQHEAAGNNIVVLGKLLKSLAATAPQSSTDDESMAFRQRQAALEPRLRDGQRQTPEKAPTFDKVWQYAEQQASAGEWKKANEALSRLQRALDDLAVQSERKSQSLGAWLSAAKNARFQLRRLQFALRATKHPTAMQIVDVIDPLVERLEGTPDSQSEAQKFEEFLRGDATITSAETPNPFGVEVKIRQPLLDAIGTLKLELPA